jgi:predicted alpha/beta-hydrolase family hydrolase
MIARKALKMPEPFKIEIAPGDSVTANVYAAAKSAGIGLILAHGAGAGQSSGFMVEFAGALAARGIDTVTFNFLYTEQRRRLPDPNAKLEACYRAVIAAVMRRGTGQGRLAIGGKSMGGRIASQVAAGGVEGVAALVFLGYPLHPPGKPEQLRSRHLPDIKAPMLFVQGERDVFGTPDELRPIIGKLKVPVELYEVAGGDHSFKVLKRAGFNQAETYEAVLDRIDEWLRATLLQ